MDSHASQLGRSRSPWRLQRRRHRDKCSATDASTIVLEAHGNHYSGPARGYNSDGTMRPDGRRTGAAIRSRQRFLGGRFEARVTIPAQLGVVSAFWSFFYEKTTTDERNHEIDIEFPGQASAHSPPALTHVTLSTWRGLAAGQSTAAFVKLPHAVADGAFHLLRFDWLPPSASQAPAVKFYIDDKLLHVARTNVPSEPANIWLGLWFPPQWAGKPEFTSVSMRVDWIRITPSRPR